MLLSSLSKGYQTLITALEARQEEDLTFAFVQQKLFTEYQRHCNNSSCDESESAPALAVISKDFECYFCKKMGQMKIVCATSCATNLGNQSKVKKKEITSNEAASRWFCMRTINTYRRISHFKQ